MITVMKLIVSNNGPTVAISSVLVCYLMFQFLNNSRATGKFLPACLLSGLIELEA